MSSVAVIGGGIAGASAGYHLAESGWDVTLFEQEASLAYHSTGRSAALYFESYGATGVRALTKASRPFFSAPPDGLTEVSFLEKRGALWVGGKNQIDSLRHELASGSETMTWLEPDAALAMVPVLRRERLAGAVWEPEALDLDVAAIHQGFVRGMRGRGAAIHTTSPVRSLARRDGSWLVSTAAGDWTFDVVVNAAGAWADLIARLAGIDPVGLQPRRRTAFMVPGDLSYASWPLVADADNRFYFRPDGVQLLCSLADETPAPPGDARPEELDVALAIERINDATTLDIRTVRSAWAGLRTFTPDREMVIGFEPGYEGFFWLAGQGGTGIQTAPAAGLLTAALITSGGIPPPLEAAGFDPNLVSPERFRHGR